MEGVVQLVNQETAFFAVETENGFTVFKAADVFDAEPGDESVGDLESATCETVLNETKGEHMEVFVQDVVSTLSEIAVCQTDSRDVEEKNVPRMQ